MPTVRADIAEGLKGTMGTDGRYTVTLPFDVEDMTASGAVQRLFEALTFTAGGATHTGDDMPAWGDSMEINGRTVYCRQFALEPWADADARVVTTWTEDAPPGEAGFGPTEIECGSTVEQQETTFDADNQALDYADRVPISVQYDSGTEGAPLASTPKQGGRVPYFAGKPFISFTRDESSSAETRGKLYVRRKNATSWRGYAAGTVLCLSIVSRTAGDGHWQTVYEFAIDEEGKFLQYLLYTDPATGQPPALSNPQLAASNGITEVEPQGFAEFNDLDLT